MLDRIYILVKILLILYLSTKTGNWLMNLKKIIFICIIMILLSSMTVAANDDNQILLKSSCLDTDIVSTQKENFRDEPKTIPMSGLIECSDKYYIVQFEGPIIQEWKDEIQTIGVEFFDYIPNNAFVLRMNETERRLVDSLEFIRWTGEYLPEYKCTSDIVTIPDKNITSDSENIIDLVVFVFDPDEISRIELDILAIDGLVFERSDTILGIRIETKNIEKLSFIDGISWIEQYEDPFLSNDVATSIINVDTVQNTLDLKGFGQIVAVCDTGLDTGVNDDSIHADIRGRILSITDLSGDGAADISGHGTHVAGSVLGNGAMSSGQYAGMAPEASLIFQAVETNDGALSGIPVNLYSIFQPAYDAGARIHTNSWGVNASGVYNFRSYYVDHFAWNNPDMLILFSSGNEGKDLDSDGLVDPDSLNSPGTAKNCITVGASENDRGETFSIGWYSTWGTRWPSLFDEDPLKNDYMADDSNGIAAFSSRGPTDDGRIKPDIVAPGTFIISTRSSRATWYDWGVVQENPSYAYLGGSSMSTPIVAGSAALVREYYTEIEKVTDPSASLMKATLLNGAYDMTPGQYGEGTTQDIDGRPDYSQGWGRLDVDNSILAEYPEVIAYFDYIPINSTSDSWDHTYDYAKSGQEIKATLVWTDFPGTPATSKALVNDLDLTITGPSGTYYGNDGPDHTNNVEGIEIENVVEGDHTIEVEAYNLPKAPQNFALVCAFTCDNNEYPANGSYAENSTTEVSADIVHPGGVDQDSIDLEINGVHVAFNTSTIQDGYRIWHNTPIPYASGENNAFITALTDSGQQFSYTWTFNIRPEISNFKFEGLEPIVEGLVDEEAKTVTLSVPYGTDINALVPTIAHTGVSIAPNTGIAQDFTNPVTYTVTAEDASTQQYTVTVNIAPNTAKEITSFDFEGLNPEVVGLVDETTKTVTLTVPYGTDVNALIPTIIHTGVSISPNTGIAQDFTNPVTYTVTAEDASTQQYTVTVNIAPNTAKEITSFDFEGLNPEVVGLVDEATKTVTLTVPYGTDVNALIPTIIHTGVSIAPNTGIAQDFTNPVTYTVTAEDASTQQYTVTVNIAPNTAKEITSFDFEGLNPEVVGLVDETTKTVTLTVPYGTDINALVPTIAHTGVSIAPNTGIAQDFTNPVTYTVTAEDASTQQYTVTVNIAPNTAKEITSFDFEGSNPEVVGLVDEATKTVTLTVPYGTDVNAMVPTIIHTGVSIAPNTGIAQDFTNPVTYTVTAEDASTQQYTVTVNIAPNTAKEITSFDFEGLNPEVVGLVDEATKTVTLTVPYGTDVNAMVPTIAHTGVSIAPNTGTAQDFTNPVTYTVTAEDASTQQYTISVNIAPNTAKEITSFKFEDLAVDGVINEDIKTVVLTVPYGTDVTSLTPTIVYKGASIDPDTGMPKNCTEPVTYTVTAEDGTYQEYTVTVKIAASSDKAITSFNFAELDPTVIGTIDEEAKTVKLTVPYGTNVTALIPSITYIGSNISPDTGEAQNFTSLMNYTVTDANGITQNYTVSVTIAANVETTPTVTPTSSGGGGGGGGGGTTGEEYENIELKDVSSMFVRKDMSVKFEFRNESNDILYVAYKSLKNSGTISVTIESLKDRSTFAEASPTGIIYKNINIWVGKTGYATPNNIDEPIIGFRVNNNWIKDNDIDPNSIVLNRYDDSWSQLSTVQTNSDDDYHYFEASTPGFSPFAITGESLGSEEKLNDVSENLSSIQDDISSEPNGSEANEPQPENPLSALSALVTCLIISFVCFLIRNQ